MVVRGLTDGHVQEKLHCLLAPVQTHVTTRQTAIRHKLVVAYVAADVVVFFAADVVVFVAADVVVAGAKAVEVVTLRCRLVREDTNHTAGCLDVVVVVAEGGLDVVEGCKGILQL